MGQYVVRNGVHCQVFEQGWRVKEWKSEETGQQELMAWKRRIYVPMGDWDDPSIQADPAVDQSGTLLGEEMAAKARQRALEASAARAKRNCRMRIKASGVGTLLTLTYRENMTDFDRVRKDWAAMLRKMRKLIPGFRAVYAFEQQKRGAWHVHAAVDKLPTMFDTVHGPVRSFKLLHPLWHSIVGHDNGNVRVDEHNKTRHGLPARYNKKTSLAKLAGYVSKYLTKDYGEGVGGRNRWNSTQGIEVSKPAVFDMPEMPLHDLIPLVFQLPDGHRIARHSVGQFGKFWVLYTEPDPG
ncbi:MAG: rolling circle replication-associated protein [Comamonas sp.]|uniref:rolling circle replication-associated protein n=1 Tax=Comamonas sp. TaxID=34028 RepID=UPI003D0DA20F